MCAYIQKHSLFFLSGFSFTNTCGSHDSRGRERTIFYSTRPVLPAHEHSDIYLQVCMWDEYQVFLIATLLFTRLILDGTFLSYHFIDWLMMELLILCLMIWFEIFLTAVSQRRLVNFNSHQLLSLYYKWTD